MRCRSFRLCVDKTSYVPGHPAERLEECQRSKNKKVGNFVFSKKYGGQFLTRYFSSAIELKEYRTSFKKF